MHGIALAAMLLPDGPVGKNHEAVKTLNLGGLIVSPTVPSVLL